MASRAKRYPLCFSGSLRRLDLRRQRVKLLRRSGVTGTYLCFTCTTGEADDSEDYEIE